MKQNLDELNKIELEYLMKEENELQNINKKNKLNIQISQNKID